jgi:anaerobic C4-dicarboxylate transporter
MRKYVALISLALAGCSGGNDTETDKVADKMVQITPGLWETKITFKTIDAKGLPEAAKAQMIAAMGEGVTVKSCLTKEQVEKPSAEFFGSPKGSNCTLRQMKMTANNAAIVMTCKPDAKTVIESQMTGQFSADKYTMDVQQKTRGTPMGDLITAGRIEGKRLGECPAK